MSRIILAHRSSILNVIKRGGSRRISRSCRSRCGSRNQISRIDSSARRPAEELLLFQHTEPKNRMEALRAVERPHSRLPLRSSKEEPMRRTLLAAAPILLMIAAPTSSKADAVGAAFGAGTGLVVAGPPGAVVGGVIGAIWGRPFWGPPNSPHACWIDNSFYRHCRYHAGRWHYY
jgi:hypothetical protein